MSRFDKQEGTNIHLTPSLIILALGGAEANDLDPAYLPKFLQPWPTAKHSFCEEDDGMKQDWSRYGTIWLNPPYLRQKGYEVKDWVRKLANHGNGILLINGTFDTVAWQDHIFPRADAILFLRGRIQFLDINGKPRRDRNGKVTGNQQPSALVAYGSHNVIRLKRSCLAGTLIHL